MSGSSEPTNSAAELARLRARVSELEGQLESVAQQRPAGPAAARAPRKSWRTIVATSLIVIGCILAPLAVVSVWADDQVSDSDRYVETVSPLADNPDLQAAVTDAITAEIFTYIDVTGLTQRALEALSRQGLPPGVAAQLQGLSTPLASAIESFVRGQIAQIVASEAFANAWDQANELAHAQLLVLLSGEQGGAISAQGDSVTINLGPFIADAKEQLVAQGLSIASNIPEVDKSFTIIESSAVTRMQGGYRLLDALGTWLPWISLALIGLGVYVAKGHRRALIGAGLGVAASMLVLGAGLAVARALYLDAIPTVELTRDAAAAVFDTLVRFLRQALRATGLAFLLLAAGAFLTGGSVTAVRTREGFVRGIGWLRGGAESAGMRTGRLGGWVHTYRRQLRVASVVLGLLALMLWPDVAVGDVIVTAVVVLLIAGVIEFLNHPIDADEAAPAPDQAARAPAG
jgi:hypothetical protein